MDRICLHGIRAEAIIGTLPEERLRKQEITVDAELFCDMRKPGKTDALRDAIDYSAVEKAVFRTVSDSSFFLLEALADKIAETCLAFSGVLSVTVRIHKPAAAQYARDLYIEIERSAQ